MKLNYDSHTEPLDENVSHSCIIVHIYNQSMHFDDSIVNVVWSYHHHISGDSW